jgi:hypothetical protein
MENIDTDYGISTPWPGNTALARPSFKIRILPSFITATLPWYKYLVPFYKLQANEYLAL